MTSGEGPLSSPTTGMARKLAAILSADVAGYSRLMGEDEEATIHTLTIYRGVIDALVRQHRGRVVDSPGDNILAEFASVVDAVQCAVAIQRELSTRNTTLPLQRRMQFRLGINLGDVIVEGERIYGDGVNIAARLESLAEAGGICISGTVYDQIVTKLALRYEFQGEQTVKNITRPVRVYRIQTESISSGLRVRRPNRLAARPWPKLVLGLVALLLVLGGGVASWQLSRHPSLSMMVVPPQKSATLALPDKPSIAVRPFVNMSADSAQEYFSDGMTEDLITDLSRLAGLFVIARNSVFTYKGKSVKPEQVSQELGVRYMLEGSVRKADNRVRITAQLIDATTGYHLWAERYDRDLQDIFAVQDDIARRITRALAVRLTPEEAEHMGQKYTNNTDAQDYFMRGMELYRKYTKADNAKARELFEKAIKLDPNFARAYANLSATHRTDRNFGWIEPAEPSRKLAFELAEKSVELDPSLPYGHQQLVYLYLYTRQYDDAIFHAEKALQLDSNYADAYAAWAQVLTYRGRPADALSYMDKAKRLNPKAPAYYHYHVGQAYYVMGKYEDAIGPLLEALKISDNFRPARSYLVAVLYELNRLQEAEHHMRILRERGRPPSSKEYIDRVAPFEEQARTDRLLHIWQDMESRIGSSNNPGQRAP